MPLTMTGWTEHLAELEPHLRSNWYLNLFTDQDSNWRRGIWGSTAKYARLVRRIRWRFLTASWLPSPQAKRRLDLHHPTGHNAQRDARADGGTDGLGRILLLLDELRRARCS